MPANGGDMGSIPGWGRYPRGGNVNPPQYSCLGNPLNRTNCQAAGHGVAELDTTVQLTWIHSSDNTGQVSDPMWLHHVLSRETDNKQMTCNHVSITGESCAKSHSGIRDWSLKEDFFQEN